jgi:hypothetical protein
VSEFMKRRGLLAAAFSAPLLTGCIWPRFFHIGWDEEVQLHGGRVIVVKVKYTYERLSGLTFDRYGRTILRNTEFSFDAGPPIGRFTQLFQKHRVDIVEHFNGKWYLLLQTRGGLLTVEKDGVWKEVWGSMQNASGQKCWSLDEKGFVQASINDLPDEFLKINVLKDYPPAGELAALDGTLVTLAQKVALIARYPMNPSDLQIERPQRNAAKPQ